MRFVNLISKLTTLSMMVMYIMNRNRDICADEFTQIKTSYYALYIGAR